MGATGLDPQDDEPHKGRVTKSDRYDARPTELCLTRLCESNRRNPIS